MRIALVALLSANLMAGAAFAQAPAASETAVSRALAGSKDSSAAAPAATVNGAPVARTGANHGRTGKWRRTGRIAQASTGQAAKQAPTQDALASCIIMWDRGTHMTRQQWARACQRVANRLKDVVVVR